MTATDDYAPINDDKISDDQYAPPPEDDAHYYDDNTYGVEVEPSSLPSNVPYAEPTDFPTKKPRTGEPTSASNINTVMPTNQQTANNTKSDDEVEVPTPVPTFVPVQPPQQQTSNREVGWNTGDIVGTSVGGFVGLLMLIPVVRFFVKKLANPSVGLDNPVRNDTYSSNKEGEDKIAKKNNKVYPLNIGYEDFEENAVQKPIKVKKIPDETIPPPLYTKINSRNVTPPRQMEVIIEDESIVKEDEELDLNLDEVIGEQQQLEKFQVDKQESTLTSLLLAPIDKTKEPSSTSVSNLVTTPVINKSHFLGGGKEDH